MPYFKYKAINKEGKEVSDIKEAVSLSSLKNTLSKEGLILIEAEEVSPKKKKKRATFSFFNKNKVSNEELTLILYEIGNLLEKNLHITKILDILASQTNNPKLKDALLHIKDKVQQGHSLASAMEETGIFPKFLIEMVKAGETSGALDKIFLSASEFLEKQEDFKSKLINSLIYPSIVIGVGFIAIIVVITFVVPKLVKIYQQFGQELPATVKFMLFLSSVFEKGFYILPAVLLLAIFLKKKFFTREKIDKIILKLPFFGKIHLYSQLFIWANTMHLLLKGGLTLDSALKIANNTISNSVIKSQLEPVVNAVIGGKQLSVALKEKSFIPENIIQLITVGEETGQMDDMFNLIAQTYKKEIEKNINLFLRYLEPSVIIFISVLIGFFIFSVLMPIFDIGVK